MYQKTKELSIYGEALKKLYVTENNHVISFAASGLKKTRGEKMKVTSIMLLKTHVEKMSETGLSIICMKTRNIETALHYIYENKGSY
jgi:hypothetical protein